jgi:hypothetical protein
LACVGLEDDAQRDAQKNDFAGLSASLPVTLKEGTKSVKTLVDMGLKSLAGMGRHEGSHGGEMVRAAGFEPATPSV